MIAEQLLQITQKIRAAEKQYQRPENSVKLLAVSKAQSVDKIIEAYQAGQIAFGENYAQEAFLKQKKILNQGINNIKWHFIGNIQSNKTKLISENFTWVHSVNRLLIAEKLNCYRPKNLLALNILIEINADTQFNDLLKLATHIATLPNLTLRGCMTMPEKLFERTADFHQQLIHHGFSLDTLSMGMSSDFESAIKSGSTLVRIGTAIFGRRE